MTIKLSTETSVNKAKRLSSFDYSAWDKYDADTELARIDLSDERELVEAKRTQEQQRAERMRTKKETIIEKCKKSFFFLSISLKTQREHVYMYLLGLFLTVDINSFRDNFSIADRHRIERTVKSRA